MKPFVFMLLIALTASCRQTVDPAAAPYANVSVCGVKNPAQNLLWLKAAIKVFEADIVQAGTYKSVTYITLYNYLWSCTSCHTYRCDGSLVDLFKLPRADYEGIQSAIWSPKPTILYKKY